MKKLTLRKETINNNWKKYKLIRKVSINTCTIESLPLFQDWSILDHVPLKYLNWGTFYGSQYYKNVAIAPIFLFTEVSRLKLNMK